MTENTAKTWKDLVAPLARKLDIAAKFDEQATWNATGAASFRDILKEMARMLDEVAPKREASLRQEFEAR
ncbi:hypothetical protein [Salipiger mucosus]|uniref:Uncharacterized protein n=1 Tax=Salipiger mucosus DSM 16094 TaxID=1123237 RepID=S9QYW7_9RHOB|nr:hypothetical protein [Salipiger mucosus]EPX84792.1 hypothetical protein Salmuc_01365 [Salipiger mucosus DSM 16094]